MRAWFTREDGVRYMALNNTRQKALRETHNIKLTPNPSRPSIKTGYTPEAFVRLANAAGWAIIQGSKKTAFVKMDRIYDEHLFDWKGCKSCGSVEIKV